MTELRQVKYQLKYHESLRKVNRKYPHFTVTVYVNSAVGELPDLLRMRNISPFHL